ncbi:hypothetical protein Tco_0044449 [Tanacetum coccineum]
MRAFIHEFKTTNELLFKERNNSLSELRFEVQGLLRVINNTPISNHEVKEPLVINHEKPVESNEVLTEDQPQKTNEPVVQPPSEAQIDVKKRKRRGSTEKVLGKPEATPHQFRG